MSSDHPQTEQEHHILEQSDNCKYYVEQYADNSAIAKADNDSK